MSIQWNIPANPSQYVLETLSQESSDIPSSLITQRAWIAHTIPLDAIHVDSDMIARHDLDPIHIKRRDDFIQSMKQGKEIKPLIVLGEENKLVDGYARYRALKRCGIHEVIVLIQI